jgi:pimeloyl-ACP methyl ester carboxylesterase
MTPRSWEGWVAHYEAKGYRVITPAYPGFEIEVEALRENPDVIANLTVPDTVDHLAAVIKGLDSPPIMMGHSFGGTLTQLLVDRGLGAAAVVVDSAPTEGVRVNPLSQVKSLFPALKNPANYHRAVGFTPEEFHYAFTNTLSEEESRKVYDRYAIAAPGNWVWAYGLLANFTPGHQETWVDTAATTGHRCFSSRAGRTTSCPRRSTSPTRSTMASPRRSRTSTSSPVATIGRAPHPAGKKSRTTR